MVDRELAVAVLSFCLFVLFLPFLNLQAQIRNNFLFLVEIFSFFYLDYFLFSDWNLSPLSNWKMFFSDWNIFSFFSNWNISLFSIEKCSFFKLEYNFLFLIGIIFLFPIGMSSFFFSD